MTKPAPVVLCPLSGCGKMPVLRRALCRAQCRRVSPAQLSSRSSGKGCGKRWHGDIVAWIAHPRVEGVPGLGAGFPEAGPTPALPSFRDAVRALSFGEFNPFRSLAMVSDPVSRASAMLFAIVDISETSPRVRWRGRAHAVERPKPEGEGGMP